MISPGREAKISLIITTCQVEFIQRKTFCLIKAIDLEGKCFEKI